MSNAPESVSESLRSPENPSSNLVVLRQEHCGLLVWSYQRDSYFLLRNPEIAADVTQAAQANTLDQLDGKLQQELASIGLNNEARINIINRPLDGRLSAPLDAYFDYTWACNLRCGYCYNRDAARDTTMLEQRVNHVFSEMAENGIMRTHLAGGEPTLIPRRLKNYLDAAARHGVRASVNTNGTNFTPEVQEILFGSNLVSLTFSLDGSVPQLHDIHRGNGAFDTTTAAIREAVRIKREVGSKTQLQIKSVWFPDTPNEELEAIINLGIDLGVDVVQFHNPERCLYHEKGYYGRVRNDYYKKIAALKELNVKYADQIKMWNVCNPLGTRIPVGIPGYHGCIGSQELVAINPDGMITPCLMNPKPLGNLFGEWNGSFSNFWRNSPTLKQFHTDIQQVDADCVPCKTYDYCRGGSKVRALVEHGSYARKDPLCPVDYAETQTTGDMTSKALLNGDRRLAGTYDYLIAIAVAHSL